MVSNPWLSVAQQRCIARKLHLGSTVAGMAMHYNVTQREILRARAGHPSEPIPARQISSHPPSYEPTAEEIRQACQVIQARWTTREEQKHRGIYANEVGQSIDIPIVREDDLAFPGFRLHAP
jgi:hypothetical protein